jgi:hypothetical protein
MNYSGEAADQIVRMSLNGVEVIAKITGAGAKGIATYLYAALKDQKKTKGKARLSGMIKSGKELKVFAVKDGDLRKFMQEAKRYGVLYCALKSKNHTDGMCDIMARSEDAAKINRIIERFNLATTDKAAIVSETLKSRTPKVPNVPKVPVERNVPEKSEQDKFIDELMAKPQGMDQRQNANPSLAKMEKSLPSEPSLKVLNDHNNGTFEEPDRPSVRKQLEEIKAGMKNDEKMDKKQPQKANQHITPANSRKPKSKAKER